MHLIAIAALATAPAAAAPNCPVLDLDFQVASDPNNRFAPQIVGWLEDSAGNFVDTVYITRETGTFGLGNRPGRFDFNSAPMWPYGRRTTTFPVWSAKQPVRWPLIVFQDGHDDNLSHSKGISSHEPHYCQPLLPDQMDAVTCPTTLPDTDKGAMSATQTSQYPPREDLIPTGVDSPSVEMYAVLNPFDLVSQATPAAGVPAQITWAIPATVPAGDYVLFLEVAKEFDMNSTYNETVFPSPDVSYGEYGLPYRGQPSVIYRVPFTYVADGERTASTDTYAGYGDPDGLDGNIRAPDGTISTAQGTGAGRLALVTAGASQFRVRVTARSELDDLPPVAVRDLAVTDARATRVELSFVAPGDDGTVGKATSYEIRFRVGEPITEANFDTATPVNASLLPDVAGAAQTIALDGLLPETTYSVGIRAYDNCRNASPLATIELTTPERPVGHVDACFIATAAYGSVMAEDVEALRAFRDSVLAKTVLGELAIEAYYTFGPPVAGVVGESDLLRATARRALEPLVSRVKQLQF